ncbi:MAG: hypothetical protein FWG11_02835 [Promicromonosporaceae bacterium]|nr:hypothetical protein [Promicromonosporaceae bacterium]
MISLEIMFVGPEGATAEDFNMLTDRFADELIAINRADIDMTATLSRLQVVFTVFEGVSIDTLLTDVRTVLHAAGVGTAGWEEASAQLHADLSGELRPA